MKDFIIINNQHPFNPKKLDAPLLLQAEYTNNDRYKLSQSYGFDLVRELRVHHKCTQPIILYSPLPESYFRKIEKNNPLKYAPLNDPSLFLLRQPLEKKEFDKTLKSLKPLSDAGLADVNEMLYQRSGIILDKLTHDIKINADLDQVKDYIKILLTDQEIEGVELDTSFSNLVKRQKTGDEIDFIKSKTIFIETCSKLLKRGKRKDTDKDELSPDNNKYTIVILEDDKDYLKLLKGKLGSHFNIKPYSNASTVMNVLQRDKKNEILAVISDWRLYEDGTKKWQTKQGYDVLEQSGKTGFRANFALTSLSDRNVHQVRNKMSVAFELVKKDYLNTTDDWENLINKIIKQCNNYSSLISSIPNTPLWKKHYFKKYITERAKTEWNQTETSIGNEASKIYKKVVKQSPSKTYYYQNEGYTLPDDGSSESSFKIKNILILRRVTMAYWFYALSNSNTLRINPKTELRNHVGQKFLGSRASNSQISKYFKQLCMLTKSFQSKGMLPEERVWLESQGLLE